MKRYSLIFIGIVMAFSANAQNETDALRYSYLNYNGTARFAGLGGAMGALGADMSAISLNPAGMARYSRNDFSFTGNLTNTNASGFYDGNTVDANRTNFNISNIGAVFVRPLGLESPSLWKSIQFGVTSNRVNDFQSETRIEGGNDKSMLSSYTNYLNDNGIPLNSVSDFYEGLAFDAGLLTHDSLSGRYTPWYNESNADIEQTKRTVTTGAQYQTDIAVSGNYNGKLYVGGSIGLPRIRYNTNSTYTENFVTVDSVYDTEGFSMKEDISTRGSGFNFKLGVIYAPVKFLRVGLALHTPTWYSLTDQYSTQFNSDFTDNNFDAIKNSPDGTFDYRLRTPGRILASAAFLYKKRGFISLEYEYVDYSTATLNDDFAAQFSYGFNAENAVSKEIYQGASIFKLGAEFRMTNFWTVRGGYSYFGSPIKEQYAEVDGARNNLSAGVGYRNRDFSIDFTYLRSQWKEESYLYDPELVTPTVTTTTLNNFMVTAGFRF
ncbi:MAG: outer membrane protein transport protein [Flavobacteriales bacterium]